VKTSHGASQDSRRALVVDDEENVAYVVATALRLDGWETEVVTTGVEAVKRLAKFKPDVIVLDVMLPDANGFELCQNLRRGGVVTPVIFLTARDATDDRVRGLTIGGDDYLTKPFSVEELVARCRLLLRRSASEPGHVLRYADLEMDEDAHQVRRAGRVVRLSPTEYKLLRYLLLNAEHVLSRRQILDHVWEYDFDGDASNVESYISFLRRKVDDVEPKLIQTVRAVGYVLRVEEG
jgi:two-component system OmpR family response regulator